MAQALPIHIIHEIERRWQRRLDVQPQVRAGQKVWLCSLCYARASFGPAIPGDAVTCREYVCSGCGHAWRNEVQ